MISFDKLLYYSLFITPILFLSIPIAAILVIILKFLFMIIIYITIGILWIFFYIFGWLLLISFLISIFDADEFVGVFAFCLVLFIIGAVSKSAKWDSSLLMYIKRMDILATFPLYTSYYAYELISVQVWIWLLIPFVISLSVYLIAYVTSSDFREYISSELKYYNIITNYYDKFKNLLKKLLIPLYMPLKYAVLFIVYLLKQIWYKFIIRVKIVSVQIVGVASSGKTTFIGAWLQFISVNEWGKVIGTRIEVKYVYSIISELTDLLDTTSATTRGFHKIRVYSDKHNDKPLTKSLMISSGDIAGRDFEETNKTYIEILAKTNVLIVLIDLVNQGSNDDKNLEPDDLIRKALKSQMEAILYGVERAKEKNKNLNLIFVAPKADVHKFTDAQIYDSLRNIFAVQLRRLDIRQNNLKCFTINSKAILRGKELDRMNGILSTVYEFLGVLG